MATLLYTAGNTAEQPLERIFQREMLPHMAAVRTFAYYMIRDGNDADDLVQVTFLKAWQFLRSYQENTNAKAWLFRICKHAFINEYRVRKAAPRKVNVDDPVVSAKASVENPSYAEIEVGQFSDEVTYALGKLSPDFRAVVLLDYEDFSYEEISAILGVKLNTVRTRLHRARKQLAQSLGDYAKEFGYGVEDNGDDAPDGGIGSTEGTHSLD
jgi:RNA polymerase sigma factor (sigma-70 family)